MNRRLIGRHLALLAVCAAWVLAVYRLGILCPIRYLTGVPCPFCGMTRAWLSALGGDWAAALRFHPLFLLGPPLIWAAVHSKVWPLSRLPRRVREGALAAGGILFFAVYLVRLVTGNLL